ncbi:MAG: hypothetical protein J5I93_07510 [Pirellulaceae bacterium]|nr:hypothetical protein [Pirellulaceae bacterium]
MANEQANAAQIAFEQALSVTRFWQHIAEQDRPDLKRDLGSALVGIDVRRSITPRWARWEIEFSRDLDKFASQLESLDAEILLVKDAKSPISRYVIHCGKPIKQDYTPEMLSFENHYVPGGMAYDLLKVTDNEAIEVVTIVIPAHTCRLLAIRELYYAKDESKELTDVSHTVFALDSHGDVFVRKLSSRFETR